MTPEETKLRAASMQNKPIQCKNKGRPGYWNVGVVVDEVFVIVSDYKHMIQKIRRPEGQGGDGNLFAYRIGYYTLAAQKKNVKWGQYTSILAESEFRKLLQQAKQKGWEIF